MKGVIFRAFLDHVGQTYGENITEQLILNCNLSSGGAYTSVGTYDTGELLSLISGLTDLTGTESTSIVKNFGKALFPILVEEYPSVVQHANNAFELISSVDNHIHIEVLKLYPDAGLPTFSPELKSPTCMWLKYDSERGLPELAEGLLQGCIDYFGEEVEIEWQDLSGGANTHVLFKLQKKEQVNGYS